MMSSQILPLAQLPEGHGWLSEQAHPVIAHGQTNGQPHPNADLVVSDLDAAKAIAARIDRWPQASLALVQVLRANENLIPSQGLDMESFAYATLQGGSEFAQWRRQHPPDGEMPEREGEAIVLRREGDTLRATLNRPALRNSITVEMRDALLAALEVLEADDSLAQLQIDGRGACFSVGGELREFGTTPDPATAHWVRSVHSPARQLCRHSGRLRFVLHGACLGSGIELPAFAGQVAAHKKAYFQLPELQLGLIPGAGGTVSLPRRIGRQRTAWLVLSGRRISAQTALAWGLIDEILD